MEVLRSTTRQWTSTGLDGVTYTFILLITVSESAKPENIQKPSYNLAQISDWKLEIIYVVWKKSLSIM
jgi:hypothetical protein